MKPWLIAVCFVVSPFYLKTSKLTVIWRSDKNQTLFYVLVGRRANLSSQPYDCSYNTLTQEEADEEDFDHIED